MILTNQAFELLASVLDRAETDDSVAIRLVPGQKGWAIRLDRFGAEDETFDYEGRTVLIIDAEVAERLEESTLDVGEGGEGPRLVLR